MRRVVIFGAALSAVMALVGTSVSAQALRDNRGPAETPPSSYTGGQYVDSNGCVFIRAGVGGGTQWVPRVRRDRTIICGQRPTGGARQATTAVAAAPAPAPTPTARPAARVVQAAPAAAPAATRVVRTQPVQQRVVQQNTQTQRVYQNNTSTATAQARNVVQGGTTSNQRCAFLSANGGCAQTDWTNRHAGTRQGAVTATPQSVQNYAGTTQTTRQVVVTRDVTHGTTDTTAYRPTWTDGRLNPTRGLNGTVTGRTGAVASATQQTWYPPRPSVSTRSTQSSRVIAVAPAPRAVSRSSAGSGHRFVQVGTFGVAANAQRAAGRLQRMGLPVRVQRSGRYQVVLVGPY
ncbi:MAG: SPOR domain-containing protein, partial [Pseudomonadota bacterium]